MAGDAASLAFCDRFSNIKIYNYEREIFKMDEPEQYDVLGHRR